MFVAKRRGLGTVAPIGNTPRGAMPRRAGVGGWGLGAGRRGDPTLRGCFVSEGNGEAIAGVVEVMKEQGQEPDANIQILDVAVRKPLNRRCAG